MSKFFMKNKLVNKIIIVLVIMILFNFAVPVRVDAAWYVDTITTAIRDFLGFIGDLIFSVVNWAFGGAWYWVIEDGTGRVNAQNKSGWRNAR